MPRFFTGLIDEAAGRAVIAGEDARHIALSLRMRPGEALTVCDGRGRDYTCAVAAITRERVELRIVSGAPSAGEPAVRVTLFQALCKGDKFDYIVQKAVELGAAEIVPLVTARCVARPDDRFPRKLERWRRIALEAAKQCGRGLVPEVLPALGLEELCGRLGGFERSLLFYERSQRRLSSIPLAGAHTLAVIVGSEGGFEEREAAALAGSGALDASLGNRILRCETAPVAALSAILYAAGEM